jgi:ABC-2 type transport system permease protein
MFREIFRFELRTAFRKPSVYLYFGLFFMLTFFIGLAASDVFSTTRSDSNLLRNSAFSVARILLGSGDSIFSLLVSVILITVMGTAIQKDYQYNTHPLFFTKPVSKPGYFFGRLSGSFMVTLFIFSAPVLGYFTGTLFGMGKPMMGPYLPMNFLQPFLIFTVPNILFLGLLFFSLITFLRTTMAAYVIAIILMVLSVISGTIRADIDNKLLAALLEPSGNIALGQVTEYWSPAEKNTNLIPLRGALLYNRLLWSGLAIIITVISYGGFSFSQFLQPLKFFRRKTRVEPAAPAMARSLSDLPVVRQNFGRSASIRQLAWLSRFEMRKMTTSVFFMVMCLLSIGVLLLVVRFMDSMYEASTYLVTYKVVESVEGATILFLVIFIIFQSGTSLWRDKDNRMDELVGVTPVRNSMLFFSKLIGFMGASAIMLTLVAIAGILLQFYSGFYRVDLWQYLVMILRTLAVSVVFVATALAFQVYSSNKYLGFFLTLLPLLVLPIVLQLLQRSNPLADFNSTGDSMPYSDMNGYGSTFIQWPFYRLYWYGISAFLCILALILYPRGKERSLKARWQLTPAPDHHRYSRYLVSALLLTLAAGAFIYYQTRVLQDDTKPKDAERQMADLEKKFGHYRKLLQPRITSVRLDVDIYPDSKELKMAGVYVITNKTVLPIDTIYFDYPSGKKSRYTFPVFKPSIPFSILAEDKDNGIRIMKLAKPLLPGDSMLFNFEMAYRPNGLFDRSGSQVVGNGTFINSSLLPTIGYNESGELSQNRARKEYGLPDKPRMADLDDSAARMNNYLSRDADWIRFEATVSTKEGQTAIAPGYLVSEWKKDGRHYFQYRMDSPILHFFSFLSADYTVRKDRWKDIAIEVYYQKGHEFNIDRMIGSVKKSLEYYTTRFGPYQHRQVRIIEFPRYMSFAQSFPNTIPYSEAIGFITKVEEGDDKIDVPFYVTAHEVAHQWWGHQVVGGDVQGSVLMSETLSQYSALMVMQQEYGKEAMKKFLKYEMDKYLLGRTAEWRGELPLMRCENQQYIHYNKGSVVMYALMDYLGEDRLNGAIRSYLEKTRFSGPPYTNAREFVQQIRAVTPDSLQYLVSDMFEKITLYENYVKALDQKRQPDGSYRVTLTVGSAKFHADSLGKQSKADVRDYMDVGIFGERDAKAGKKETVLLMQRIRMDAPEKTFEFTVREKPVRAGIDPYLKLIDRTPGNNTAKFGETPAKPDLSPDGGRFVFKFGSGS